MISSVTIAPHRLEAVWRELGNDLAHTLAHEFMPWKKRGNPRERAELREARGIVSCLKYPDVAAVVHLEEMAWALSRIREVYRTDAQFEGIRQLEQAAAMLGIDLKEPHMLPSEIGRKISNELKLAA
jgi:hypothetical protein